MRWALLKGFDAFELLHLAYNLTVAFLFLIRARPFPRHHEPAPLGGGPSDILFRLLLRTY